MGRATEEYEGVCEEGKRCDIDILQQQKKYINFTPVITDYANNDANLELGVKTGMILDWRTT